MKLLRLHLSRYGHLSDLVLEFPETTALHVLLGPNEAGKSTALAALADALFGFGHRTDFDFLHGGPHLRVGFALRAADGRQGEFWRRKGRRDTLRDDADRAVGEEALRPYLGGVSRETFEQTFGLNGDRLREGAASLLQSGGEAGESILAGMGLLHLRTVADQLGDEARGLVGDGRGKRRLSDAADDWRKATEAARAASVRPAAWAELTDEHARQAAELAAVQARVRALSAEQSRLERVRRVRPLISQLDSARQAFADVADAPRLPADAEERWKRWSDQQRDARRDYERETGTIRALAAQRDTVETDPAILELEVEITAIVARQPLVLQAEHDLPGVREQVAAQAALVREAGQELGSHATPEQLRELVPSEAARRAAQRAIDARVKVSARIAPAAEAQDRALRERDKVVRALAAAPEPPPALHLRKAVDDARAEGKLEAELDVAERDLDLASRTALDALRALPFWERDAAALAAAPVPLEADARAAGDALIQARKVLDSASGETWSAAADIVAVEQEIAELVLRGTVPTREAVAEARADRDRVWRQIRRGLEGASPGPGAAPPETDTGALSTSFETLRDKADRLADQRADDAQRVADYEIRMARLAALRQQRAAAEAKVSAADARLAAANQAWCAVWAPCGLPPKAPDVMAEWRRDRAEVLRLFASEAHARARRDGLAARRDRILSLLRSLFPSLPSDDTLAALLVLADAACRQAEAAIATRARLAERLDEEGRKLEQAAAALRQAQADLDATDPAWTQAVKTFALPADASVEAVQLAQAAWARIAEAAKLWRSDGRRVQDMAAAIEGFGQAVRTVLARVAEVPDDVPPSVLLDGAARRLAAAKETRDEGVRLTKQLQDHSQAAEEAQRILREAERELSDLRTLAHAADDLALEEAVMRAKRRTELEAEIAKLGRAIGEQGDLQSEAALREATAAVDADAATARLDEIERERADLGSRRETLATAIALASTKLSAMEAGGDAAARAQEAEAALADARSAAERYARLHIARKLLQAGIDRVRREQQGPLLKAAGENFAVLTNGRYVRLAAGQDGAGKALIQAVRADGLECPVDALSEGTRDQLYLALRVATIQSRVAASEPLPFVADDLLVQFDDGRAAAAIDLLVRLGQQTQVLLFTHHRHVAEIASAHAGISVQAWPSDPAVS